MTLRRRLSDAEIRISFDRCLKDAMELGLMAPTDRGLDDITTAAICVVAQSYPRLYPTQVQKARNELEAQLDGTHERVALAGAARWLHDQ